jgi:hypothetical protein
MAVAAETVGNIDSSVAPHAGGYPVRHVPHLEAIVAMAVGSFIAGDVCIVC